MHETQVLVRSLVKKEPLDMRGHSYCVIFAGASGERRRLIYGNKTTSTRRDRASLPSNDASKGHAKLGFGLIPSPAGIEATFFRRTSFGTTSASERT